MGDDLSGTSSLNFNSGTDIGGRAFHGGPPGDFACGKVTSPPIDLGAAPFAATLSFWASYDLEVSCDYDLVNLEIRPTCAGQAFFSECLSVSDGDWEKFTLQLDPQWGTVEIEFLFEGVDDC